MRRPPLIILAAALASGCDAPSHAIERAAIAVGITDEPPLESETIDLLCDHSAGSPCTEKGLARALGVVLAHAAKRPDSVVRVWMLGENVASTSLVATVTSPAHVVRSEKADRHAQVSWIEATQSAITCAAKMAFQERNPRRSPIFEGIAKVALAGAVKGGRTLAVVSDGREVSNLGDFECGTLPDAPTLGRRLQRNALMSPGSLHGIRIHLWGVGAESVGGCRCPATIARTLVIQNLWRLVLTAGGAMEIEISTDIGTLGDEKER